MADPRRADRRPRPLRDDPERPTASGDSALRALLRGCVGGLVATAVMTAYRIPIFRALPPTAEFWARYVGGGDAEQYVLEGLLLHFCYGAAAGGVFGSLLSLVHPRSRFDRELTTVVAGLVYGLVLSAFGTRVVFRHVLERDLEPEEALVFHVGHVVYGLTLGTWVGSRERYGAVYE